MSGEPAVRFWDGRAFVDTDVLIADSLAADSWRVDDGTVVALGRHRLRFADAVADAGGDRADALSAARAAVAHVPATGSWSPRLDLTPQGITMRVRPAPETAAAVRVVTATRDPRTNPWRKGPDLEALGALLEEASAHAGEPVEPILLDGTAVAEGARSALLWWRDDVLCVPADDVPRMPSVTAAVIRELARRADVQVQAERVSPEHLEGCEVWLANALRGIRTVERWIDGPALAAPTRAAQWQARLESLRLPAANP